MHAATIECLVQKGKFEPQIAVAIGESIDMAIQNAQLVTVPILDARLAALEARMDGKLAVMEKRFAEVDARFVAMEARLDVKFARLKTDLLFWIIAVAVGNNYLPPMAAAVTAAIRELLTS